MGWRLKKSTERIFVVLIDDRSYIYHMARVRKSDDIRITLLEVGLATFAKRGYHGTGIKEIVDNAGVPKGSFYNYFKSKEDFGIELVQCHSKEFWETLESCFDHSMKDTLQALVRCFEMMIADHEECTVHHCSIGSNLAAELSESSVACRNAIQAIIYDWRTRLAEHIHKAQVLGIARTDVTADDLAQIFWDAWHGSLIRVKIANTTEPLKQTVSLVLNRIIRQ